jgi:hypothetical protein
MKRSPPCSSADPSCCICHLPPTTTTIQFPCRLVCVDGCVDEFSILRESALARCSSLRSICIPSSIETISDSCFAECDHLLMVTFESHSKLSTLGERAFELCSQLHTICIPSSTETISRYCFSSCGDLSHFAFEPLSKLTVLGDCAFQHCLSLRSIRIPSSIQTISKCCFVLPAPFKCDFRQRLPAFGSW